MNAKLIIDLLVHTKSIDEKTAETLSLTHLSQNKRIDTLIYEQAVLTHDEFYGALSEALGMSYYDISDFKPSTEVLALIPAQLARQHGILPLFLDSGTVFVSLSDPCNSNALDDLRFVSELPFEQVLADVDRVLFLIQSHYHIATQNDSPTEKGDLTPELIYPFNKHYELSNIDHTSLPIAQLVNLILDKAVRRQASDIHLEPFETEFKIRYRRDGTLCDMISPPCDLALAVISYIKVLANLDITEQRVPQDGRIQQTINGHAIDLRVSTLPTAFGESTVLRVLDRHAIQLELETLIIQDDIRDLLLESIHKPHGIVIITGPTGSGKTTTLYSCLRKLNTADLKILTVEDPIEYEIDGIVQVAINENIGLDFSKALRALLRQDPDCIMIGEIRDMETAQIAIQAALTGHLVLTTLHTNDTFSAITRLENFGIEPFLISSCLEGVLAQRLIRKICPHCRKGNGIMQNPTTETHYYNGGCKYCNFTGYLGRKGIYEFLVITNPIRELINNQCSGPILRQKAKEQGMTDLRCEGLKCVDAGDTTLEEILKYS